MQQLANFSVIAEVLNRSYYENTMKLQPHASDLKEYHVMPGTHCLRELQSQNLLLFIQKYDHDNNLLISQQCFATGNITADD